MLINKIKVYLFYLIGMFLLLVNMNVKTLYVNFFGFLVCSKIIYTFEKKKNDGIKWDKNENKSCKDWKYKHFLYWNKFLHFSI